MHSQNESWQQALNTTSSQDTDKHVASTCLHSPYCIILPYYAILCHVMPYSIRRSFYSNWWRKGEGKALWGDCVPTWAWGSACFRLHKNIQKRSPNFRIWDHLGVPWCSFWPRLVPLPALGREAQGPHGSCMKILWFFPGHWREHILRLAAWSASERWVMWEIFENHRPPWKKHG